MNKRASSLKAILLAVVSCIILIMPVSSIARDINQDHALALRKQGQILDLTSLLKVISTHYPGLTLLEVELKEKHGQYYYEVEFLTTQGVAREIKIDASDARILKDEVDD